MSELHQQEPEQQAPRSLFDIVKAGLDLLAELDEAEGEVTDALGIKLDELAKSITDKAEAYKAVAMALDFEADACDRFAEVYSSRAKRKRENIARLKARLKEALEALGYKKAVGPTGGARIQKNGAAALEVLVPSHELEHQQRGDAAPEALAKHLNTLAERGIPRELLIVRVELDKAEVKRRLEAEEELPFARLVRGDHLRWA